MWDAELHFGKAYVGRRGRARVWRRALMSMHTAQFPDRGYDLHRLGSDLGPFGSLLGGLTGGGRVVGWLVRWLIGGHATLNVVHSSGPTINQPNLRGETGEVSLCAPNCTAESGAGRYLVVTCLATHLLVHSPTCVPCLPTMSRTPRFSLSSPIVVQSLFLITNPLRPSLQYFPGT